MGVQTRRLGDAETGGRADIAHRRLWAQNGAYRAIGAREKGCAGVDRR